METRTQKAFLILVLAQAAHSIEEFVFRLYDVFAPARYVSGLVGLDRALGFAIANGLLFLFGLWCWWGPVRRGNGTASTICWIWGAVEVANGFGHIGLAAAAGGYFPGLATAPLLVAGGFLLIWNLVKKPLG